MTIFTLVAMLSLAPQGVTQERAAPPSPFAGFETHHLTNGLKVWYKYLPDDPVVSISVALPFGADRDPAGKEQLAHFTEHMLFADQPGLSEEEIRSQIEELGGVYNAIVSADKTVYYVRIGREHALFALDAPHAMDPEVVDRQRQPVALEVRARPRQFFDWVSAYYLYPPRLRLPGFWEREFGIETRATRDYYPHRSLNDITPDDLRRFYDSHYVPSLMTLTVIGDVEKGAVLERIDSSFASLPARAEPEAYPTPEDPGRYHQAVFWAYRSNVYFRSLFKFYDLTADEEVMLVFISRLLGKRLNDQLRFGERKATYGIGVGVVKRGRAAYLQVSGGIKPDEYEYARSTVEREIEALRTGALSDAEFEEDRAAVARQLRVTNTTSEDLEGWVRGSFYDPRVHEDFPDLLGAFERTTKEDVERFASAYLVPERRVLTLIYPHPVTQGLLFALVVVLVWLSAYLARGYLMLPVDMTIIRYVARFRMPRLYQVGANLALIVLLAVGGRLLIYAYQIIADSMLISLNSFVLQWTAYALMLMATVLALMAVLSRVPRKLLLFEDRILIKYLSYRSLPIDLSEVEEFSLLGFRSVWLTRRLWKCVPLTFGIFIPAIYLKRRDGWSYYFNVRDRDELVRLARDMIASAPGLESGGGPTEDLLAPV
jgi:predicted Zn-dependent peptidase